MLKLLSKLKDIHLPPPIGCALAPGWYALIILLALIIATLTHWAYRRYRNSRAKKQALVLLEQYVQDTKKMAKHL